MAEAPRADRSEGGLSRRTVVRRGATLAWAVPVVTVVAAAPAFAQSGIIVFNFAQAAYNGGNTIAVGSSVRNADAANQPTSAFRFILTLTPTGAIDTFAGSTTTTPTGYTTTAVGTPTGPGMRSVQFTYTASAQIPGNNTSGPALNATITPLLKIPGTYSLQGVPGGAGTSATAMGTIGFP